MMVKNDYLVRSVQATSSGFARTQPSEQQLLFEERKRKADQLAQVELRRVFEALGDEPSLDVYGNQDGDPSKWKISSVGNIITKGQRWQNTMTCQKGYGGLFLVQHVLELKWVAALEWMWARFGDDQGEGQGQLQAESTAVNVFALPELSEASTRLARTYLINERGLPPSLIDRELAKGRSSQMAGLYGAHPLDAWGRPRTEHHNIIFKGPASAEIRGVAGSTFKGCLGGSLPDHSGYRVAFRGPGEPVIAMTEAAIDALSYHTLFPGRLVISTNGSGSRFPLHYKLAVELSERCYEVSAAFDADEAGDHAAQRLCNALLLRPLVAHQLQVELEQVDEWLLDGILDIGVSTSPHENFFNVGWAQTLPIYSCASLPEQKPPHPANISTACPVIRVAVKQSLGPGWEKTPCRVIPVGEKAIRYLSEEVGLRRDRPEGAKDWNDVLRRQGPQVIQTYEKNAWL